MTDHLPFTFNISHLTLPSELPEPTAAKYLQDLKDRSEPEYVAFLREFTARYGINDYCTFWCAMHLVFTTGGGNGFTSWSGSEVSLADVLSRVNNDDFSHLAWAIFFTAITQKKIQTQVPPDAFDSLRRLATARETLPPIFQSVDPKSVSRLRRAFIPLTVFWEDQRLFFTEDEVRNLAVDHECEDQSLCPILMGLAAGVSPDHLQYINHRKAPALAHLAYSLNDRALPDGTCNRYHEWYSPLFDCLDEYRHSRIYKYRVWTLATESIPGDCGPNIAKRISSVICDRPDFRSVFAARCGELETTAIRSWELDPKVGYLEQLAFLPNDILPVIEQLVRTKPKAPKSLLRLLALRVESDPDRTLPALVRMLDTPTAASRTAVLHALRSAGELARESLEQGAMSENANIAKHSKKLLKEGLEPLTTLEMADRALDPSIRREATNLALLATGQGTIQPYLNLPHLTCASALVRFLKKHDYAPALAMAQVLRDASAGSLFEVMYPLLPSQVADEMAIRILSEPRFRYEPGRDFNSQMRPIEHLLLIATDIALKNPESQIPHLLRRQKRMRGALSSAHFLAELSLRTAHLCLAAHRDSPTPLTRQELARNAAQWVLKDKEPYITAGMILLRDLGEDVTAPYIDTIRSSSKKSVRGAMILHLDSSAPDDLPERVDYVYSKICSMDSPNRWEAERRVSWDCAPGFLLSDNVHLETTYVETVKSLIKKRVDRFPKEQLVYMLADGPTTPRFAEALATLQERGTQKEIDRIQSLVGYYGWASPPQRSQAESQAEPPAQLVVSSSPDADAIVLPSSLPTPVLTGPPWNPPENWETLIERITFESAPLAFQALFHPSEFTFAGAHVCLQQIFLPVARALAHLSPASENTEFLQQAGRALGHRWSFANKAFYTPFRISKDELIESISIDPSAFDNGRTLLRPDDVDPRYRNYWARPSNRLQHFAPLIAFAHHGEHVPDGPLDEVLTELATGRGFFRKDYIYNEFWLPEDEELRCPHSRFTHWQMAAAGFPKQLGKKLAQSGPFIDEDGTLPTFATMLAGFYGNPVETLEAIWNIIDPKHLQIAAFWPHPLPAIEAMVTSDAPPPKGLKALFHQLIDQEVDGLEEALVRMLASPTKTQRVVIQTIELIGEPMSAALQAGLQSRNEHIKKACVKLLKKPLAPLSPLEVMAKELTPEVRAMARSLSLQVARLPEKDWEENEVTVELTEGALVWVIVEFLKQHDFKPTKYFADAGIGLEFCQWKDNWGTNSRFCSFDWGVPPEVAALAVVRRYAESPYPGSNLRSEAFENIEKMVSDSITNASHLAYALEHQICHRMHRSDAKMVTLMFELSFKVATSDNLKVPGTNGPAYSKEDLADLAVRLLQANNKVSKDIYERLVRPKVSPPLLIHHLEPLLESENKTVARSARKWIASLA